MPRRTPRDSDPAALDALLEEILADACGEDEQLQALRQAIEDEVPLPVDAFVLGEPVAVVAIDYDGNQRRGLTARCRRDGGEEHVISLADVRIAGRGTAVRYVDAYRKWLGLEALPPQTRGSSSAPKAHKAGDADIPLDGLVELVVLSVKERAARCRLLNSGRILTLRAGRLWTVAAGQIVSVRPRKQWRYAGHPYLSGDIEGARIDAQALDLVPLRLDEQGEWDPEEEYWGEGPIEPWAQEIIARGPRPMYEMEQVLPGADPDTWDSDPIIESNDRRAAGDVEGARDNAHLGNMVFDVWPNEAICHYESAGVGVDRQPAVLAMPARIRTLPLASWTVRGSRAGSRPDALAQPIRQPGRTFRPSGRAGGRGLGA